jgi:hypothetical protein
VLGLAVHFYSRELIANKVPALIYTFFSSGWFRHGENYCVSLYLFSGQQGIRSSPAFVLRQTAENVWRNFLWGVYSAGMGDNPYFAARGWLGD